MSCLVSSSPLLPPSLSGHSHAHVQKGSPLRLYRYSSFRDPFDETILDDGGEEEEEEEGSGWTD